MSRPTPLPSTPPPAMPQILAETNLAAGPSDVDRQRITEALRARLGTAVLPDGFVPPARGGPGGLGKGGLGAGGLGTRGWIGVVVGTGAVAGALGFVLGYGMAGRDAPQPVSTTELARVAEPAPKLPLAPWSPVEPPASPAEPPSTAELRPNPLTPQRKGAPLAPSPTVQEPAPSRSEPRFSFAEVLERLQRANVALRQGHSSLALIQLSELDRRSGDVLREERDTTRVLALCASGDRPAARRAAAPLLSGSARSIYAPRLDSSCVGEGEPGE